MRTNSQRCLASLYVGQSSLYSLPYAVSQAGFVTGIGLLIGLAFVTDWTIRLVVVNAKLSGRDSYIDVSCSVLYRILRTAHVSRSCITVLGDGARHLYRFSNSLLLLEGGFVLGNGHCETDQQHVCIQRHHVS